MTIKTQAYLQGYLSEKTAAPYDVPAAPAPVWEPFKAGVARQRDWFKYHIDRMKGGLKWPVSKPKVITDAVGGQSTTTTPPTTTTTPTTTTARPLTHTLRGRKVALPGFMRPDRRPTVTTNFGPGSSDGGWRRLTGQEMKDYTFKNKAEELEADRNYARHEQLQQDLAAGAPYSGFMRDQLGKPPSYSQSGVIPRDLAKKILIRKEKMRPLLRGSADPGGWGSLQDPRIRLNSDPMYKGSEPRTKAHEFAHVRKMGKTRVGRALNDLRYRAHMIRNRIPWLSPEIDQKAREMNWDINHAAYSANPEEVRARAVAAAWARGRPAPAPVMPTGPTTTTTTPTTRPLPGTGPETLHVGSMPHSGKILSEPGSTAVSAAPRTQPGTTTPITSAESDELASDWPDAPSWYQHMLINRGYEPAKRELARKQRFSQGMDARDIDRSLINRIRAGTGQGGAHPRLVQESPQPVSAPKPSRFASIYAKLRKRGGKRGAIAPMSPEEIELLRRRPLDRELQRLLRRGERLFPPGLDPETFKKREAEVRRVRGY